MRKLIIIVAIMLYNAFLFAQTRRMNHAVTGMTYTTEQQNQGVLPLLIQADRQFRLSDIEGTFLTLESAVAQNQYAPEALVKRATFKRIIGMETEAEADIILATSLNPLAPSLFGYHGGGGLLKVLSIEPEEAIQELDNMQRLEYYRELLNEKISGDAELKYMLANVELITEYMEGGQLGEANAMVELLINEFPASAIAHDLKGLVLRKQGDLEAAAEAVSEAVVLAPDFAVAWYNFSLIEKEQGNYEQAKIYLDRAIGLENDLVKAYFDRALILKKMGAPKQAIDDYTKVIDLGEMFYTQAFLNRGLTKKMAGDYTGALNDLNQALIEFPDNAELLKNRGNLQLLFGMPYKAIDDYTEAIALKDNYVEAYYNRAMAHFLLYNKISGCYDLSKSMGLGYGPAMEVSQYFCPQY